MEIKDFIEKFAEQFDDAPAELSAETNFKELEDWNSLVALSVISMVDEEYEVTLKGEDIRNAVTVGDLFEIVKGKM